MGINVYLKFIKDRGNYVHFLDHDQSNQTPRGFINLNDGIGDHFDYSNDSDISKIDKKIINGLNHRVAELYRENAQLRKESSCFFCGKNKVNFELIFIEI